MIGSVEKASSLRLMKLEGIEKFGDPKRHDSKPICNTADPGSSHTLGRKKNFFVGIEGSKIRQGKQMVNGSNLGKSKT